MALLKSNTLPVLKIDLSKDDITDKTLKEFYEELRGEPISLGDVIAEIDVSGNDIRNLQSVIELLHVLHSKGCKTVKLLKIQEQKETLQVPTILITPKDAHLVLQSIEWLDISNNAISYSNAQAFCKLLLGFCQQNDKLQSINLASHLLTQETKKIVFEEALGIAMTVFISPEKKTSLLSFIVAENNESQDEETNIIPEESSTSINDDEYTSLLHPQTVQATPYYHAMVHWLQRETLLRQLFFSPRPMQNVQSANAINNFLDGMALGRYTLWPTVLAGALLNDLIFYYTRPQYRYGNTIGKILGGVSVTERTFSTYFGSYLAGELNYWLAPILLISAPVITGAISSGIYQHIANLPENSNVNASSEVARAEFAVLWSGNITSHERLRYVKQLVKQANQPVSLMTQISALRALAQIINAFKSNKIRHRYGNSTDIDSILNTAINGLNNTMQSQPIINVYRDYLRWSVGELQATNRAELKRYLGLQILMFWPSVLYSWYSSARFWELLAQKIYGGFSYYFAERTCNQQQMIYAYVDAIADYACGICPDWSFVNYDNMFSAQGCLDDLLAITRPLTMIQNGAARLVKHSGIEDINLSQQNWTDWNQDEWQTLLDLFEGGKIDRLRLFNFSQPQLVQPWIHDQRVAMLSDFLLALPTEILDLKNQPLEYKHWQQLLPGLNQTHTHKLDVDGIKLGDSGFVDLAQQNPQMAIRDLQASNAQIGNYGAVTYAEHLNNETTHLDLSHNPIGVSGVITIMQNLGNVETLNLSGVDLSAIDMNEFGAYLQHSQVSELNLADCSLSDDLLSGLMPYLQKIKNLNIAGNAITVDGIAVLMAGNQLAELNVSRNDLGDEGVAVIAENLSQLPLQRLIMEDVNVQLSGFAVLVKALPNSQILYFNAAKHALGDAGAAALADVLSKETCVLEGFYLGANQITGEGGKVLMLSLLDSNVTHVELPENRLTDETAFATAEIIHQGHPLKHINYDDNDIGPEGAIAMIEVIPGSSVTYFYLNNNPLNDTVGVKLAQSLVSPIPNQDDIATTEWGHDDTRYLWKMGRPATQLEKIGLANCNLDKNSKRALQRILPLTDISWENVDTSPEQISSASSLRERSIFFQGYDTAASFWRHQPAAVVSSNSNTNEAPQPFMNLIGVGGLVPGLQLLILLYVIYSFFKPVLQQPTKRVYDFFSAPKPREQNTKIYEQQENNEIGKLDY